MTPIGSGSTEPLEVIRRGCGFHHRSNRRRRGCLVPCGQVMKVFTPPLVRRSSAIGVVAALLGLGLAFAGLGLAGFFVAAALTAPVAPWISRADERSSSRTGT
jgi:hypothetical protein